MLALLGGSAALVLAYLAVAQARTLAVNVPRIEHISVDTTVLIFAFVVSIGSGILSGLAPCIWGARPDLNDALQEGGRQQSASGGSGRVRSALIMVEVALAFVLTIGAGLMVQSSTQLVRVGLGVDPESVLTFSISLPDSYTTPSDPNELTTPPRQPAFYDEVVARITRLPGVSAVGVTSTLPLRGNNWTKYLSFDDRPVPLSLDKVAMVQFRATDGDYFRAMRIKLRKGRFFEAADNNRQSVPVAIVNSALAQRFCPNQDPIGKLIWPAPPESLLPPGAAPPGFRFPRVRIVGIVDDVHYGDLNESAGPELYAPLAQSDCLSTMFVAVRTQVPPSSLISSIRGEVAAIDRGQPIARIATMEEVFQSSVALPRLHTLVLGAFGALALGLAAVGLYGVIAQSVAQRRHEVGVRIALGARPQSIVAAIVGRAMGLVAIGLAAGCGLALALTHLMSSLLFGVTATDPWTFAGAAALLIVTSILASYLPARRAASVDPMVALRCD